MTRENCLKKISGFESQLRNEEKSAVTIEKYLRDVRRFLSFLSEFPADDQLGKEHTVQYKKYLCENGYEPASVNSMLVALNCFLRFCKLDKLCVKLLKIQRQIFSAEDRELSCEEYHRLIKAADGSRLSYIIQTICGTGIRVSELKYITVEAVREGKATVSCKNKNRVIFLPVKVQKLLSEYIRKTGIKCGSVFVSKSGKPLNRSNIWRDMRRLCEKASVSEKKVFPHNLRHLFARLFYSIEKDIVRLADLLGHSSINTTRIYTKESGEKHLIGLERVQKILTT